MNQSLMILGYKIPKDQVYKKRKKKMGHGLCECSPTPKYTPDAKFCHLCGRSILSYTDIINYLIIKEIDENQLTYLKSFFDYEVFIDDYLDHIYIGNVLGHVEYDAFAQGGVKIVDYSEELVINDELTFEKINYIHRDLREKLNDYEFGKEFGIWIVIFDI
jgi:hypothetical protein